MVVYFAFQLNMEATEEIDLHVVADKVCRSKFNAYAAMWSIGHLSFHHGNRLRTALHAHLEHSMSSLGVSRYVINCNVVLLGHNQLHKAWAVVAYATCMSRQSGSNACSADGVGCCNRCLSSNVLRSGYFTHSAGLRTLPRSRQQKLRCQCKQSM